MATYKPIDYIDIKKKIDEKRKALGIEVYPAFFNQRWTRPCSEEHMCKFQETEKVSSYLPKFRKVSVFQIKLDKAFEAYLGSNCSIDLDEAADMVGIHPMSFRRELKKANCYRHASSMRSDYSKRKKMKEGSHGKILISE